MVHELFALGFWLDDLTQIRHLCLLGRLDQCSGLLSASSLARDPLLLLQPIRIVFPHGDFLLPLSSLLVYLGCYRP